MLNFLRISDGCAQYIHQELVFAQFPNALKVPCPQLTLRRGLEDYDKNRGFVGILAYGAHRLFCVHVLAAERRGDRVTVAAFSATCPMSVEPLVTAVVGN